MTHDQPAAQEPSHIGVAAGYEGVVLQRGGEELALDKVDDRFTLRLKDGQTSVEAIAQQLGVSQITPVPSANLLDVEVDPSRLETIMQQARALDAVDYASHVYCLRASPNTLVYLTDELAVQFRDGLSLMQVEAIATAVGLRLFQRIEGIAQGFVFRVTKAAHSNPIKLANQLMRQPDVLTAEPNVVTRTQKLYRPADSDYGQQWYLHHNGGPQLENGSHISVEPAWDVTRGDRSIVVAVIDDGFDLNHPDFQGEGKLVAPYDRKGQDGVPQAEGRNENHGTACAGVAIAEENRVGIVGVAPGCSFMPIRSSGFLDDRAIEDLFQWATNQGAAVISCSWGPALNYYPLSLRQRAAISRAVTQGRGGKGCVIVFAAGNANRPVNGTIAEQGWADAKLNTSTNWLNGFALHPDVISVAASTSLNRKAAYSNWGATISVAAPSNNAPPGTWMQNAGYVYTAPPIQGNLLGRGVFTSDRQGSAGYDSGSYTPSFGGTSSACPVVAGVAALVLSVNPDLTAGEVKQILQDTADKITDPEADPQLGFRRGTYDANGHSQWFGYGKVNALKAVKAAQQRIRPIVVSRRLHQGNTVPLVIPDNDPRGVLSSVQMTDPAPVQDLQVTVQLEHSFLGDLSVHLVSPQGVRILLQGRSLGRAMQLQTTYTLQTTPALRRLLHLPANGTWQLHLVDHAPLNQGRLMEWHLALGL